MSESAQLPRPSAELFLQTAETVAIYRFIERNVSKKAARQYLADKSEALGLQEAAYNVLKFRPRTEDRAALAAMAEARAWWSQILGVLTRLE